MLIESIARLKKQGIPEPKYRAVLGYVNRNDNQVVQKVLGCLENSHKGYIQLESLVNDKIAVEQIDEWEDKMARRAKTGVLG